MKTFTDPRDKEIYKTVKIGNLLWFTENLRYRGVPHYFPDRNSDNVHRYGCLYTWDDAKAACPEDWRLPTKDEFGKLFDFFDVDEVDYNRPLRDKSWKDGKNSSKFSALPAGYSFKDINPSRFGSYAHFGFEARFWSTTPYYSSNGAYDFFMSSGSAYISSSEINYAYSVRCVKEI